MMKLKRAITNTFIAATLLLASCSPFNSNFAVYEEDTIAFEDYVAVKAILANYRAVKKDSQELHSSQSGARLIRPELNVSEYDFYIYGQKSYNDTKYILGPYNITSQLNSSGDSGEFELSVPRGTWYMTLIAVKQNQEFTAQDVPNVTTKALLTGCCIADFQNTDSHPNFVLSDAGLTTPGTLNIKLSLDEWTIPEGISAKAGLYYMKTGKAVSNTEQELTITESKLSGTYSPQAGGNSLEVNPGTYIFCLTFYNAVSKHEWVWSDKIHIFPGREVHNEIFIPKVINEKPQVPQGFTFALDTEDSDYIHDDNDFYSGVFKWTLPESGTIATHYELKLYEETAPDSYTLYKAFTKGVEVSTILYRSGSLDSSSDSLTLWLPLGKKLKAELCAVNRTGNSDAVTVSDINLYRVTYNLNGGRPVDDSLFGEGSAGRTGLIYDYKSVSNPHIWKVIQDSDKGKLKTADDDIFDKWTDSSSGGNTVTGTYNGYENIMVWAQYKTSSLYPLERANIKYTYYSDEELLFPEAIDESDEITIQKTNTLKLYFDNSLRHYQNFRADIVENNDFALSSGNDTDNPFIIVPTVDLNTGSYTITISADTTENKKVSYSLKLNITE